jgi:hypothetical protein
MVIGLVVAAAWIAILGLLVALCQMSVLADRAIAQSAAANHAVPEVLRAPASTPSLPRSVGRPVAAVPLHRLVN